MNEKIKNVMAGLKSRNMDAYLANDKKEDDVVNVPELGLASHVPCMVIGAALMSLPR